MKVAPLAGLRAPIGTGSIEGRALAVHLLSHDVARPRYVFAVFFSAILMNYVFMDGKSDYFQGVVLLVIYCIMVSVLLW